jgi:hypothetical protein
MRPLKERIVTNVLASMFLTALVLLFGGSGILALKILWKWINNG